MKALEFTKLTNCVGDKINNFSARLSNKHKTTNSSQKINNDLLPDVIKSVCDHEPVEPLNSCCFIYTCKKCGETYDIY